MTKIQIGATGHAFKAESFEEVAQKLHAHRIPCIQLTPPKIVTGMQWNKGVYTPALARYITAALGNVHISALGCYINMADGDEAARTDAVERFKQQIVFAKYLGADIIATETGWRGSREETRSAGAYESFLRSMREMAACAEKLGVVIGIEAIAGHTIYSVDKIKQFLADVPSPNIGLIFDVVGLLEQADASYQRELMDAYFASFSDKLKLLHLKDFRLEDGVKKIVPLGTGVLELDYYLQLVQKHTPFIDLIVESLDPDQALSGMQTVQQRLAY